MAVCVLLWPSLVCVVVCGMVEWMWYGNYDLALVCDDCGGDDGCFGDVCGVKLVEGGGVWVKAVWSLIGHMNSKRGILKMTSLDTYGMVVCKR